MQYLLRLRQSVGHRQQNQPDDVLRVKTALNQLGYYDIPEQGLGSGVDDAFVSAIRAYQQQRGLESDGQMRPGGPTERDIESLLQDPGFDIANRAPILRCIICGAPHGGVYGPICHRCWERLNS